MQRFKKIKSQEFLINFDPNAKVYRIFKSEYIGDGYTLEEVKAVISEHLVSESFKFSDDETKVILSGEGVL